MKINFYFVAALAVAAIWAASNTITIPQSVAPVGPPLSEKMKTMLESNRYQRSAESYQLYYKVGDIEICP